MRSGSLRHPPRRFDWTEDNPPRRWAQRRDRPVTDQDGAPGNGDWLSEFPAETEEADAPISHNTPAIGAAREPLWTVISHESGPAWPAPPDALDPPPAPSARAFRALAPAAEWIRLRPARDRKIGAAAIGAAALAGVILFAVTRDGSDPVAEPIASAPTAAKQPVPIPERTATDTRNTASPLPPAPPAVTTRDRPGLDRGAEAPPPTPSRGTRGGSKPVTLAAPPATKVAPPRDIRAANADASARREAARPPAPAAPLPTPTPAPAPPPAAVTTAGGTGTTVPGGQPVLSPPPAPARPTPTPTPTATPTPPAARVESNTGSRPAPPPAEPAAPAESSLVQSVLNRYRQGYSTLNADAVAAAYPAVNARSLARAFDQLESQQFDFSSCKINVNGTQAEATCGGTASFVPKVGNRTRRSESRQWTFSLVRVNDGWIIRRAESR